MIVTLVTNIEAAVQAFLPDHFPISYAFDVDKNTNLKINKRFGVLSGPATVVPGVTRSITMSQDIKVRLTAGFTEPLNDIDARLAANTIADNLIALSKHLSETKCNTPGVMVANLSDISDTEYLDTQNTVSRTAIIKITHRV